MQLTADAVAVAGTRSPLVRPTSFTAPPARVTAVAGDPGYGQVALALALAGRMPLAAGRVLLEGLRRPGHPAAARGPRRRPRGLGPRGRARRAPRRRRGTRPSPAGPPGGRAVAGFLDRHGVLAAADAPFERLASRSASASSPRPRPSGPRPGSSSSPTPTGAAATRAGGGRCSRSTPPRASPSSCS